MPEELEELARLIDPSAWGEPQSQGGLLMDNEPYQVRARDRAERVWAAGWRPASASPPAPVAQAEGALGALSRDEIARVISPWAFDGSTSSWPNQGIPEDGRPYRKEKIEAANLQHIQDRWNAQAEAFATADRLIAAARASRVAGAEAPCIYDLNKPGGLATEPGAAALARPDAAGTEGVG